MKDITLAIFISVAIFGTLLYGLYKTDKNQKTYRASTYEIYYGKPTYQVYCKLHPDTILNYDEWVVAKKANLISK